MLYVGPRAGVFLAGQSSADERLLVFGLAEGKDSRTCVFFPGEWKRFVQVIAMARNRMFTMSVTSPRVIEIWKHRSTVAGAHESILVARLAVKTDPLSHDWRTFLEVDVGTGQNRLTVSISDADLEKLQKLMTRGTDYLAGTLSLSATDAHDLQADDRTRLEVGRTSGSTTTRPSVTRGVVAGRYDTTYANGWLVHFSGQVQPLSRYYVRMNRHDEVCELYVATVRGNDCVVQPVTEGLRIARDDEIEFVSTVSVAPETTDTMRNESWKAGRLDRPFVTIEQVTPLIDGSGTYEIHVIVGNHGDASSNDARLSCTLSTFHETQAIGPLRPGDRRTIIFRSHVAAGSGTPLDNRHLVVRKGTGRSATEEDASMQLQVDGD